MMITGAAINIAPRRGHQIGIVENALPCGPTPWGWSFPKGGSAVRRGERHRRCPSTVSAAEIAKRGIPLRGVRPPLDGAISQIPSSTRAFTTPWRARRDILLVPFIGIGNVLYKSITYIAGKTMASTICGASCPVIITGADTPPDKASITHPRRSLRCPEGISFIIAAHRENRQTLLLRKVLCIIACPEGARLAHSMFLLCFA